MNSGLTPEPELESKALTTFSTLVYIPYLKSYNLLSTSLFISFTLFYTLFIDFNVYKLILFIFYYRLSTALLAVTSCVLDFS